MMQCEKLALLTEICRRIESFKKDDSSFAILPCDLSWNLAIETALAVVDKKIAEVSVTPNDIKKDSKEYSYFSTGR